MRYKIEASHLTIEVFARDIEVHVTEDEETYVNITPNTNYVALEMEDEVEIYEWVNGDWKLIDSTKKKLEQLYTREH